MNLQFDEIISAPCRLGILATLVPGEPVSFTKMKEATSLSDGNLHVQTRKLADAGYIAINKVKKGRRSVTLFEITELGRDRLRLHVTKLQQILGAGAESPARRPTKGPEGAKQAKQPTREAKKQAAKRSKKRSGPPARRPDDSAVWL